MTEKTVFKARTPKTRDEALLYIEKLCQYYDIQLEEDALLEVINAMEQKHDEQLRAYWLQAIGSAMHITGKEFITVDAKDLQDRRPFDVRVTTHGQKTMYRLVKD